jgi:hypothetical protein
MKVKWKANIIAFVGKCNFFGGGGGRGFVRKKQKLQKVSTDPKYSTSGLEVTKGGLLLFFYRYTSA